MGWTLPRALLEFFRGDADRGIWFGGTTSTGQITGGIIFLVALGVFLMLRQRAKRATGT
jgi:prolipoprotein diacylglyceryltransferase